MESFLDAYPSSPASAMTTITQGTINRIENAMMFKSVVFMGRTVCNWSFIVGQAK